VLDQLRAAGELITTSEIEHISRLAHQHIHLYGRYPFDPASRPDGHRPLRAPKRRARPRPHRKQTVLLPSHPGRFSEQRMVQRAADGVVALGGKAWATVVSALDAVVDVGDALFAFENAGAL
jgi:hypothetical protein